jgi:hypothetical protein
MTRHKHVWTSIAPEVNEAELQEYDSSIWYWCIRCGRLKLDETVYSPGQHQRETIVPDKVRRKPKGE